MSLFTCFTVMKFDSLRLSFRQIKDHQVLCLSSDLALLLNWHRKSEALERWGGRRWKAGVGRRRGRAQVSWSGLPQVYAGLPIRPEPRAETDHPDECMLSVWSPGFSRETKTQCEGIMLKWRRCLSVIQHQYLCSGWIVAAVLPSKRITTAATFAGLMLFATENTFSFFHPPLFKMNVIAPLRLLTKRICYPNNAASAPCLSVSINAKQHFIYG